MNTRRTAALMVAAAVLVNVAFTGLGAVFDYPDVLKQPAVDVLAAFRANQFAVTAGFLALALGAAMLAPVAIGVGRLSDSRAMRWSVPVGIAAAAMQVVGLLRWPLLVPSWATTAAGDDPAAAEAAREAFGTANRVLGNLIGETGGYVFTAAWTGLVLGERAADIRDEGVGVRLVGIAEHGGRSPVPGRSENPVRAIALP